MLSQNDIDKIKDIVKSFFNKTSFDIDLEILPLQDKTIPIKIKTDEPRFLIGQNGQTLSDMQRLLKAILRKQILSDFYIDIDINDYKKKKIDYLHQLAKESADEAVLSNKEISLNPMSSYERRVVHMVLAERKDILVQSTGQEPYRKISIKPLSL